MARNNALHRGRAIKAWPLLVARARVGGPPFTYGELSALVGCHHRVAGYFLGDIQRYCAANELPRLQALAVNKETDVPGDGYAGATGKKKYAKELKRVYKHAWNEDPPF